MCSGETVQKAPGERAGPRMGLWERRGSQDTVLRSTGWTSPRSCFPRVLRALPGKGGHLGCGEGRCPHGTARGRLRALEGVVGDPGAAAEGRGSFSAPLFPPFRLPLTLLPGVLSFLPSVSSRSVSSVPLFPSPPPPCFSFSSSSSCSPHLSFPLPLFAQAIKTSAQSQQN